MFERRMSWSRSRVDAMQDRDAADLAKRVLLGLAGVLLGLNVAGIGRSGELLGASGWMLVVMGLAFAGGCVAWAVQPKD